MKPITLEEALLIYTHAVVVDSWAPQLYLKDGDNHYHSVDEIDLYRDRIRCDDGYWDYYNDIMIAEDSDEHILFVKES